MQKIPFEYRISIVYFLVGCLWILFSDRALQIFTHDIHRFSHLQTYKGWFYVIVTTVIFFLFLKKHLKKLRRTENELEKHKKDLTHMVSEKTKSLDTAMTKLKKRNKQLSEKTDLIDQQNKELKHTVDELKNTQERLIQSEKMASLGVLTAGIAHEINNPLNFIMGGAEGLTRSMNNDELNNSNMLYIDSINTGIQRINAIVTALNKMNPDTAALDQECDIHAILDNCLLLLSAQTKTGPDIIKRFNASNALIMGNMSQLHQVFINILMNALQATEKSGTVTVSTHVENDKLIVDISDTGSGIPSEILPKISDPFFTTKEPGEGTGLGLSICYNLIKAHGGSIHFSSEPNVGTTVSIRLKLLSE